MGNGIHICCWCLYQRHNPLTEKGIAYVGKNRLMSDFKLNTNILLNDLSQKEKKRLPSYCRNSNLLIEHISDCLGKIYLSTNKKKIDRLLQDMKMDNRGLSI